MNVTLQNARNGCWWRGVAAATDLLFPPQCVACGCESSFEPEEPLLCRACCLLLVADAGPACPRCAARLPLEIDDKEEGCAVCRTARFRFDRAVAWGPYRDSLRETVLKMKNRTQTPLSETMGRRLADLVGEKFADDRPDLVVPVPMHWSRRMWRGTHTAGVLARAIAGRLGWSRAEDLLLSRRKIKPQHNLTAWRRKRNVRGAFMVSASYAINGAKLLLVDDILTTGATANEAAKELCRAGAEKVSVAVVARGGIAS